jgi:hypothetical protein
LNLLIVGRPTVQTGFNQYNSVLFEYDASKTRLIWICNQEYLLPNTGKCSSDLNFVREAENEFTNVFHFVGQLVKTIDHPCNKIFLEKIVI